ncbi:MAG: class II aldolase/adducin family protein [Candidatus Auribacterota bacterium]|jgi:L-fuculose-phosphate aldolase|nr:class II aldolase/adducin family protein [Candidatus Auribacterota bacterium]
MTRLRDQLRQQMVDIGNIMYKRGYVVATDGNISVRIGKDAVLITPSGVAKGTMEPSDIVIMSLCGKKLSGKHKPSSEYKLHLAVYSKRPDVQAVIHAHPPLCTALTLAGVALDKPLLPEVVLALGYIPTAPYGTPSTDEVPRSIEPYIATCDAILMERHGSVTVGVSLTDAYNKLEKLEHYAQTVIHAMQIGSVQPISPENIEKLSAMRESYRSHIRKQASHNKIDNS